MELKTILSQNGQELQTGEIDTAGDSAGLADDRVLAEALRLAPNQGAVSRAVLPYGWSGDNSGTVTPTTAADGSVYIAPFRAVIGSRTNVSTDGLKGWRDIRSAVFVAGADPTTPTPVTALAVKQALAANSSGLDRWDLIYAAVTPDANANTVQRAVKNPTTGTVTIGGIATQLGTKVTIGVVTGTPNANPVLPVIPPDAGGVYYIPLAFVTVPNGWNNTSTAQPFMIYNVAETPPSALSKSYGGANLNTPNVQPSATVLAAWANGTVLPSTSARPTWFVPQEMRGKEELLVTVDLPGTGANWSYPNFGLVDSSRDWRQRFFKTTIFAQAISGSTSWAQGRQNPNTTNLTPDWAHNNGTPEGMANNITLQFGQSFVQSAANMPGTPPGTGYAVCFVNSTILSPLTQGLGLYIWSTAGALRLYVNGVTNTSRVFFWLEASGPFPSY